MTPEELLERYKPQPRYDSQEAFFADSAEEMTANPGNQLRRAGGEVIASAGNGLTLDALGTKYADGSSAAKTDVLGVEGKNYRDQYTALREARPDLRNRIYGHAQQAADGHLWLQYWFWYFYNDYHLAADFGLHEGDWEMIELRVPSGGDTPDLALYAQHAYAESRPWDEVEKSPDGRPVTYPGRGSHASYFAPGLYETVGWYDIVDGKREAPDLALEVVPHTEPGWIQWPGAWGDTKPISELLAGLEEPSPTGPAQHPYWDHPEQLMAKAVDRVVKAPLAPPELDAARKHDELWVIFDFTGHQGGAPLRLIATVNSADENGVPPKTFTFDVEGKTGSGQFDTKVKLAAKNHYEVDLSIVVRDGDKEQPTASRCCPLNPGVESAIPDWVKHPVWEIEQFFHR
ncbi:MAG TPA: hypothetical protein VGF74_04970 [Thermoleophilaceae bacterium]